MTNGHLLPLPPSFPPSFLFPLLRLSGRNEAVSRAAVSASAKIPAPIPLSFLSLRRRRRLALPHLKEEEEAARKWPLPLHRTAGLSLTAPRSSWPIWFFCSAEKASGGRSLARSLLPSQAAGRVLNTQGRARAEHELHITLISRDPWEN